jgi:hypothetical protein
MREPPVVRTWARLMGRFWPAGRTGEDAADARVTFIAGPPCEFLRVLSQQEVGEAANPPTGQQPPRNASPSTGSSDLV